MAKTKGQCLHVVGKDPYTGELRHLNIRINSDNKTGYVMHGFNQNTEKILVDGVYGDMIDWLYIPSTGDEYVNLRKIRK